MPAPPALSRAEAAAAVFIHEKSKNRPFHWGPFPLETLPRDASRIALEAAHPRRRREVPAREPGLLVGAVDRYRGIYAGFVEGETAPAPAPLPDDLERRAADIKGGAYFMDASQVGICRLPHNAWCAEAAPSAHDHAVVVLVEHGRLPEPGNLARGWVDTFRARNPEPDHYTWWSQRQGARARNVGWRIDYVLASRAADRYVRAATIHPEVMGSDHCPVGVELDPAVTG